MTPQEKAQELIDKYKPICAGYNGGRSNKDFAKKAAIIAVDEILKCESTEPSDTDWDDCGSTAQYYWPQKKVDAGKFWGNVKTELIKQS